MSKLIVFNHPFLGSLIQSYGLAQTSKSMRQDMCAVAPLDDANDLQEVQRPCQVLHATRTQQEMACRSRMVQIHQG